MRIAKMRRNANLLALAGNIAEQSIITSDYAVTLFINWYSLYKMYRSSSAPNFEGGNV
jgi:hypothetical protein